MSSAFPQPFSVLPLVFETFCWKYGHCATGTVLQIGLLTALSCVEWSACRKGGITPRGTLTGLRGGTVGIMDCNKAKCKVLHLCQGNPKHKEWLGGGWIESSPEEKGQGRMALN